jgi:hypothetical protein
MGVFDIHHGNPEKLSRRKRTDHVSAVPSPGNNLCMRVDRRMLFNSDAELR